MEFSYFFQTFRRTAKHNGRINISIVHVIFPLSVTSQEKSSPKAPLICRSIKPGATMLPPQSILRPVHFLANWYGYSAEKIVFTVSLYNSNEILSFLKPISKQCGAKRNETSTII